MKNKIAFTFVELIVVVTILAILAIIGTVSYTGYISDSRDAKRQANLSEINSALKLQKQNRGSYPLPSERFNISYNSDVVAYQGKMGSGVSLSSMDVLPLDPKLNREYNYSVTSNRREFQISASLENSGETKALVLGDYKSVAKDTLPSITIATSTGINIATDRNKFIFDNQSFNLPYTFSSPYSPISASGTTFSGVLNDAIAKKTFWQNSDFRSCEEIEESGKLLNSSGIGINYQVIDNNGNMQNISCNPYDACTTGGQILEAKSTYPGCNTKDIIVCTGVDVGYTIAACNVGATIAGTDHNNPATVGQYFQYGRNKGFISSSPNQTTKIQASVGLDSSLDTHPYIISSVDFNWATDETNNNNWTNSSPKGPCSDGYYIGKNVDWQNIVSSLGGTSNVNNIKNNLKIPYGGMIQANGVLGAKGSWGIYWYPGSNGQFIHFHSSISFASSSQGKIQGSSIRCFKN